MTPYRQAHRPESRLRWYVGLAAEVAFLAFVFIGMVLTAGLIGIR